MPRRIRLSRARGWRLPERAVNVARPTRWGNPFRIGDPDPERGGAPHDRASCVALFEKRLLAGALAYGPADARAALAGRDLACWCPLDGPCHADVLLRVANETE